MADSIDNAVNQSKNRELLIGAGVEYLGKDRRRDAERLADLMTAAIERVCVAANVTIAPRNLEVPPAVMRDLGNQVLQQTETVARVAVEALMEMFRETLRMAGTPSREQ